MAPINFNKVSTPKQFKLIIYIVDYNSRSTPDTLILLSAHDHPQGLLLICIIMDYHGNHHNYVAICIFMVLILYTWLYNNFKVA